MIDWSTCSAAERSAGKVGGAWVFKGTRVPVHSLFENLEDGASIEEFVACFLDVGWGRVEAVPAHARRSLAA